MPRSIQLCLPPQQADLVLERLRHVEGIVGVVRHRDASCSPPGDVLLVQTTNDASRPVFELVRELGVLGAGSVSSSEPHSLLSPGHQEAIDRESNETTWEEMAVLLRQDTNAGLNYLALTFLAGAIAAAGLWADMLHVVVGAMVIAPAFEPLIRLPFGLIAGPRVLALRGASACLWGYLMIGLGGAASCVAMLALDTAGADLASRQWVRYWSSFSAPGVWASALGAVAGAFVILALRSVLTTGVMIALALVPSFALAGMALVVGDLPLALRALARWAVDAALVMTLGGAVFWLKQKRLHRRRALG